MSQIEKKEDQAMRLENVTVGQVSRGSEVAVHSPVPNHVWREMFEADADAVPTQTREWLDCLCASGRYQDASRLYEMSDGRRALLPLVRRSYLPGGPAVLESMPKSWGYGGLIAPEGVTADLAGAVFDDLSAASALRVHLRPNPLHAAAWEQAAAERRRVTVTPARAHVLDLDGGFDQVWRDRFSSSARSKVRRAERLGVAVEQDTTGRLVPIFYELLLRSFDRWADQQHEPRLLTHLRGRHRDPIEKFQVLAAGLGERCKASVAWYEGRPAAAILVLQDGNAHYTRGAMDKPLASRCCANYLLQKLAVEEACHGGCRTYHMGETGASGGLAQFKGHFGAEPVGYAEYWIERLPLTRMDGALRKGVKRLIGFQDA